MSIATEITRLQTAKADLKTAIEGKGVTVPTATKIDGYADLVESIETGGGGGGLQSGSFIGTNVRSIQVPVTSECSKFYAWAETPKGDDDLSGSPYGSRKVIGVFVDNDTGFCYICMSNNTSWGGAFSGLGRWGGNTSWSNVATFNETTIRLEAMTVGGGGATLIDGETYNWVAW